jgi:hypothetical protein
MKGEEPVRSNLMWEESCTALEDLFRALRTKRQGATNVIPYEFVVPGIGRQLMLMKPIARPRVVAARKALDNLAKSSERVLEVLDTLPNVALQALNVRLDALHSLKLTLRVLHHNAKIGIPTVRSGAPTKDQPRRIARVVAQHYFGLTGRKPAVSKKDGAPSGNFLDLLKAVYKILGVDKIASAVSQAEEISRNWPSVLASFPGTTHGIK